MTCTCLTQCREWFSEVIIDGHKYQMSTHLPNCINYKLERFVRIVSDEAVCICEPHETSSMLEGLTNVRMTDVLLTRDQFESIPEFSGW